ncbi:hypothetical protein MOR12E_12555 [Methylobacterium oryzae]
MTSRFIGYLAAATLALSVQLVPAQAAPLPVGTVDGGAETPLVQTVQHWGHHHHHGHHHHWRPRHHHHHHGWGHHHHHWRPHHHHGWGHHHHHRRHHHHHF